jgi:hypothetical protein
VTGSAKDGRINASGASRLNLTEFLLKKCHVDLNGASNASFTVKSKQPFTARLSGASVLSGLLEATDLDLGLDGASTVTLRGTARDAKLGVDGASQLKLADLLLDGSQLLLAATGSSSVKLTGKSHAAVVEATGTSQLDLEGLVIDAADVKLSSVSHAKVDVRASLKYDLSSISSLIYSGNPSKLDGKKSGGATISHR